MPLQQSSIFSLKNKKKERKKEKRPTIEVIFPFQLNVSFEVPPILIPVASVKYPDHNTAPFTFTSELFLGIQNILPFAILMYICMSFFRH